MKHVILLIFSLFITNVVVAQEQAIKITNDITKKEIIIKENKRVRIKTVAGEKISGRFSIENNKISIKNRHIELTDIDALKRNPLLTSIFTSGFLVYGGAVLVGGAVIVGLFAETTALLWAIPGAGMIYVGLKSPNFNKNYKKDGDWSYEFITIPD